MNKLYNTQEKITNEIREFLKNNIPNLRKTQLNIIPEILFGMIASESVVSTDIAKCLKNEFSYVQLESVQRRIRRFFNNDLFDSEVFFNALITYVISKYSKKHKDNRIHITFDHMFSHDNYVTLMFTMRVGKQGIPIWFKSFKQEYINKEVSLEKGGTIAFNETLIIEGIKHVSALFDGKFDLIFLADRWFNSENILKTIASLGHTYCIRLKKNIKIFSYEKKEVHKIWKWIYDLPSHKYHAIVHKDVKHAIKNCSHRFGSIECVFKNQKSNGFYLENINNASEKAYNTMYTMACTVILFLTIIGADYSKNTKCYNSYT